MSNLQPKRIINKNGVATTVHTRVDEGTLPSQQQASIPRPCLGSSVGYTFESRLKVINEVMVGSMNNFRAERFNRIFREATPQQLSTIDEALREFGKYPVDDYNTVSDMHYLRQSEVLSMILYSTDNDPQVFHELMAVRSAFSSPWACNSTSVTTVHEPNKYVRGLREHESDSDGERSPLDLSTPERVIEAVALVRFAYEANCRFKNNDYNPMTEREEHRYASSGKWLGRVQAVTFQQKALRELVIENAGDVGRLLNLIEERHTSDPNVLRALIEDDEGAKSLASGYL